MYELVILTDKWINSPEKPKSFEVLANMLNKSYSKPMARFGIIQSKRISNPADLKANLDLLGKEAFLMLLLGSRETFSRIQAETGWKRKFDSAVWPLTGSRNSDIPTEYLLYFGELTTESEIQVTVPECGTELDEDVLDRVLASTGYKLHESRGTAKVYELTAVTSFLARMGGQLLDYANNKYLSDRQCPYLALEECSEVVLRVVVIKEHLLVPYYEKLGYRLTGEPDLLFDRAKDPTADRIRPSRDFHWAFMEMSVQLRK